MGKRLDLVGQQFERLTAISFAGLTKNGQTLWLCRCSCGAESHVKGTNLQSGNTRSCGCLQRQIVSEKNTTHGASKLPEYQAWADAKRRCTNPNHEYFSHYGGRGIKFLFNSFEQFYSHIGPRPHKKLSLDRIDNNGHYQIGNVHWATSKEQSNNRRNNVNLVYKGRTQNITDWARELGIHCDTIRYRLLKQGWSVEKAFETPVDVVILSYQGKTQSQATWARELGLSEATLSARLKLGWSIERALSTPVEKPAKAPQQGSFF